MIHIKDLRSALNIFKALGSDIRIRILELLLEHDSLNMNELASKLNLSNGAITMHIKKLEESGIINFDTIVGKHGIQKSCYLNKSKLLIDFEQNDMQNLYEVDIKVGHYIAYEVVPTCGLATKDSIIGEFDDPRYFSDPEHINADIIWLTKGYVDYWIPNYLKPNQKFEEIQIIMELGSEAPSYNNDYPSDIHFYLNGSNIGYWTSPGDFGDKQGAFNPDWWPPHLNQYGFLKMIRINTSGTYIDGCRISDTTIDNIQLNYKSEIKLRIGVPDDAANVGGLTIFGGNFGNYKQDITVRVIYKNQLRSNDDKTAKTKADPSDMEVEV